MTKTINLLANYDPIGGVVTGPIGALPIQTPVSPNGKYVVTANTLTGTITIIDTDTDTLVKSLPCDAGCHGVNFAAKRGGGYLAYVSSKFSNSLIVVDPDPNNDGEPTDAAVIGRVVSPAAWAPHRRPRHRQCRHGRTGRTADPTRVQRLGPERPQHAALRPAHLRAAKPARWRVPLGDVVLKNSG